MFVSVVLFYVELLSLGDGSTQPPTVIPSSPPVMNSFYSLLGASQHRQDKKLDVKPIAVFEDLTRIQCLGMCLHRQGGPKAKRCRSFNYANGTCQLLTTYLCDGERELTDAPGFSYFDLVDDYSKEKEFIISKQCETKGKCSSKCLKFKLFKTPMSWNEAHAACREEAAFLAMPRSINDHDTLIGMMKKKNILQSWIGIRKRDGVFYYDNGVTLGNLTLWGPDQPNDSGGTQQCVQMMSEMSYLWNDFDCMRPMGFVCQYVW